MPENNPSNQSGSAAESFPFPRSEQDVQDRLASGPTSSMSSTGSMGADGADAPGMDRVVRGAHDAVDKLADKAGPAMDSLRSAAADMSAMQEQWVSSCREHVREHPLASVATAAVAGLLLGRLMAR